jgi:protein-S-isoprenylcysteine O-methyltransferase Ste14
MSAHHQIAANPPESDVSGWVGLVGIGGLFAWLLICHEWPALVDLFGLPSPHLRLSGSYAALTGLLFSGSLMAAWSVLVDKVHRNPSTGIDWDNPRPLAEALEISVTKIAGLWASWAVIGFLYCIGRWYWDGQYLFAMDVIGTAAIPLFVLSVPYILWLDRLMIEPRDHAWHFGAMLINREPWDLDEVKKHCRAWGIKGFYIAFMISIVPGGFAGFVNADWHHVFHNPVEAGNILIGLLFLIDVQIGTVGYLLTFRPLDAHIRSGNPLLAGWLAALMCYPPFVFGIMADNGVIGYHHHTADWTYWFRDHTALLWVWAALLCALTAIYAWATVAFGIRFSNLTYRGILTNGPYRFSRHPAYLSKNIFWWLSTLPFLVTSGNPVDMIRNTFGIGCVSAIYYWRARTEEAHLLGEDAKYREYHAWMAEHGLITSRLRKLLRLLHRQPPAQLHPAE